MLELRQGILEFGGRISPEDRLKQPLDDLLAFLSEKVGKTVDAECVKTALYEDPKGEDISWIFKDEMRVSSLYSHINFQEESLKRVSRLVDKSVEDMRIGELEQAMFRMFTMLPTEYMELIKEKGIEPKVRIPGEPAAYWRMAATVLIQYIYAQGVIFDRSHLREELLKKDWGLGYYEAAAKQDFSFFGGNNALDRSMDGLHRTYHDKVARAKKDLESHLVVDAELQGRHTISPPALLKDKTITVQIVPYVITFVNANEIAVLGNVEKQDSVGDEPMLLHIYDVRTGALMRSIETNLFPNFSGTSMGADGFLVNLTASSDGTLSVKGQNRTSIRYGVQRRTTIQYGVQRFTPQLQGMENEGRFLDALGVLDDADLLDHYEPFQILEDEGLFYFSLQPAYSVSKTGNNALVVTDGKTIKGSLLGYSPRGRGIKMSGWQETARIAIHGNDLYVKMDGTIMHMDRSLTEKSNKEMFSMIPQEEMERGCVASNHCVDPKGTLYVVTQTPNEVAQSIKGYVKGEGQGIFVTHVYPQNHPGGWAAFRSMAICTTGMLAYSDFDTRKVHLYQVAENKKQT